MWVPLAHCSLEERSYPVARNLRTELDQAWTQQRPDFPPQESLSFRAGREFSTWQAGRWQRQEAREMPLMTAEKRSPGGGGGQQTPRGVREIQTPLWIASAKSIGMHSPLFS